MAEQLRENLRREFQNILDYSEFTFSQQTKELFVQYFYDLLKKRSDESDCITDPHQLPNYIYLTV